MPDYQTHEHDVLVVGAGGAGLRAAIEASTGGVSVGLVCKSLLGKAHTVMAEGGIAAALANVDDRDNWKVHFADTMRGGQYVNNWRMAELHAKEAPARVRELEAWGAVFDRTADGRILQRNFGGHKYPRLAHVGDRTGLEMIRTVQDEGGILTNNQGKRFMFEEIPELYRAQTADTPEEGWRYCQGDKSARRPPELLTRDHVARCIVREIKAGRGSPHGGVFLDISWIKKRLANAEELIKKKLPSMYHQFLKLADIDITREPMEVGPTTHYIMGGVRVESESQMSTVLGLFAAGECAAGLHGANRLGGNSLSDLLVFGQRAGAHAAQFAKKTGAVRIDEAQVEQAASVALAPFEREGIDDGAGPYRIQHELQQTMQDLVGIVRTEGEMLRALEAIARLGQRAERVRVAGNRAFNPGWHTALELRNLMTVSEAVTRSALERKESRGAHFRDDHPGKDGGSGKMNVVVRRGPDGTMQVARRPIAEMRNDLRESVEEMK